MALTKNGCAQDCTFDKTQIKRYKIIFTIDLNNKQENMKR